MKTINTLREQLALRLDDQACHHLLAAVRWANRRTLLGVFMNAFHLAQAESFHDAATAVRPKLPTRRLT